MRETFFVRKSYFKGKCRESSTNCPVAQAIAAKRYTNIFVGYGNARFENRYGQKHWTELPKKVALFIMNFDNHRIPLKTFKPFKFTLNVD